MNVICRPSFDFDSPLVRRAIYSARADSSLFYISFEDLEKVSKTMSCHQDAAGDERGVAALSHEQFQALVRSEIKTLIRSDPVLGDLDADDITTEDVEHLLALHHGQAMHVKVLRGDDTHIPLVLRRDATLLQLRRRIKIATLKELEADRGNEDDRKRRRFRPSPARISWKYVWKTYGLEFENVVLTDLNRKLVDAGVRNGSTLTFVKLRKAKTRSL